MQQAKVTVAQTLTPAPRIFLSIWLFSAFLTEVAIIPGIRNNVGPFEICGLLSLLLLPAFKIRAFETKHPLIQILATITIAAALSQLYIGSAQSRFGIIQVAIMVFLLVFVTLLYNVLLRHQLTPAFFLEVVAYAILVVGPWIILTGVSSGGDIQAAGPFRTRAHMGSYMLTAFWMVLMLALWPGIRTRLKYVCYSSLALTLYAIAVSGRRSVYLSLLVGLAALAMVVFWGSPGRRSRLVIAATFIVLFLGGLYYVADAINPQTAFFKERVSQIDDRLRQAAGVDDTNRGNKDFFALQREGVMMAFRESPIIGIGWGGFAKSRFSPTGHEVHSTPLRFLAELGVLGLGLYALMIAILLSSAVRMFRSMRQTPYGASYLALTVAIWSMSVSYLYNRHVTERTFWIFLVVFLAADAFARRWHELRRALAIRAAADRVGDPPKRGRGDTALRPATVARTLAPASSPKR